MVTVNEKTTRMPSVDSWKYFILNFFLWNSKRIVLIKKFNI